jgi:hypothetical protein
VVGLLVLFNWSARSPPQPEAAISLKQLLAIAIDVAARGGVEVVRYVSCLFQPEAAISLKQLLAIAIDVAARGGIEVVRFVSCHLVKTCSPRPEAAISQKLYTTCQLCLFLKQEKNVRA